MRNERKQLEAKGVIKKNKLWDKFLKDDSLEPHEKFQSVITTANNIEKKAKEKEELLLKKKKRNDFDVQDEINDLYLDSIKAKLALLNLEPQKK